MFYIYQPTTISALLLAITRSIWRSIWHCILFW